MSGSGLHLIKPRTEAEARADRAMRTATPERIEPTPEDLEISRRTVRRLMRWSQEHNLATAATPERHINGVKPEAPKDLPKVPPELDRVLEALLRLKPGPRKPRKPKKGKKRRGS